MLSCLIIKSIYKTKNPSKLKTLFKTKQWYSEYAKSHGKKYSSFASSAFMVLLLFQFASCQEEMMEPQLSSSQGVQPMSMQAGNSEMNVLNIYPSVTGATAWELQQARAATARYRDIKNAIKDTYVDIAVVKENMGYHYMKVSNVDATFDYRQPEILVYNKNDGGEYELVAVEYAVPLNLSATAPEGFSGNDDVWDENHGFGLWLLHAWVWSYNPDGVFNPTNPLVHLH